MCRRRAQRGAVEGGPVALGLVEAQGVGERLGVDVGAAAYGKRRRDGFHRSAHRDGVRAGIGQAVEVEGVDVPEPLVPGTRRRADRQWTGDDHAVAAYRERRAGRRRARHEIGPFGSRRGVADLIDTHEGHRRDGSHSGDCGHSRPSLARAPTPPDLHRVPPLAIARQASVSRRPSLCAPR